MRFVIVTGLSGAGKSSAMKILEDSGYFCVDNLPVKLVGKFCQILTDGEDPSITHIAVGIDSRSGAGLKKIEEALEEVTGTGITPEILYMEASDAVLTKRFKETRRSHPLAGTGERLEEGIGREREALAFLRSRADYILDTSHLLIRDLQTALGKIFVDGKKYRNLYVTVMSFGFKYGLPEDADLVFDVRFLPNPYYVENLKALTGEDAPVRDFVLGYEQTQEFLDRLESLVRFLIPHYIQEGKHQLVIAVGCTGGRHRSVAIARALHDRLSGLEECGVKLLHRDIDNDPKRKAL